MKSIVFFIGTLSSGGAEHQLSVLANFLSNIGYKVTIVTYGDSRDHYLLSTRISRIRIGQGKGRVEKFIRILSFFFRLKADVVISFTQRSNLLAMIPLLFRPRIKKIMGERNLSKENGGCREFILFNFLYFLSDYIVSNSYTQYDYIINSKPRLSSRLRVIPNYTDPDLFRPVNNQKSSQTVFRIGVLGRYSHQKNYSTFLKGVALSRTCSNRPFEVHWYGNIHLHGDLNPDYSSFISIVDRLNLNGCVFAHDHSKDVVSTINEFDAMCLPSLYEGFSNSLSEYICCAKPVIASDVSDNHLLVHDGINGFLFIPTDISSISSAIVHLLSLSSEKIKEMGENSRTIAVGLFNKDKFIHSYRVLIES